MNSADERFRHPTNNLGFSEYNNNINNSSVGDSVSNIDSDLRVLDMGVHHDASLKGAGGANSIGNFNS